MISIRPSRRTCSIPIKAPMGSGQKKRRKDRSRRRFFHDFSSRHAISRNFCSPGCCFCRNFCLCFGFCSDCYSSFCSGQCSGCYSGFCSGCCFLRFHFLCCRPYHSCFLTFEIPPNGIQLTTPIVWAHPQKTIRRRFVLIFLSTGQKPAQETDPRRSRPGDWQSRPEGSRTPAPGRSPQRPWQPSHRPQPEWQRY